MLSISPWKNLYPPLNRPIPPKIAIDPDPPLTEDFQNYPIPPKSWGVPTMPDVSKVSKIGS